LKQLNLVFPILAVALILSLFGCTGTSVPAESTAKVEKTVEAALQRGLGARGTLEPFTPVSKPTRPPKPTAKSKTVLKTVKVVTVRPTPTPPSSPPVFAGIWGTEGKGNGEFSQPMDVAVASDGSVYVADTLNNRIQKFTSEGVLLCICGTSEWEGPMGTVDTKLFNPRGVAVASDGSVYVADSVNDRIQKLTSEGVFAGQWGTKGTGNGQFNNPAGVAVASDGSVYVADTKNDRIQKFTSLGVFVSKWGTSGTGDGKFNYPYGVAVATDGSVYVADKQSDRIQKFTSEGVFVTKWGTQGTGDGQLRLPARIAVASDGSVYVADSYNNRVQKFSPGP